MTSTLKMIEAAQAAIDARRTDKSYAADGKALAASLAAVEAAVPPDHPYRKQAQVYADKVNNGTWVQGGNALGSMKGLLSALADDIKEGRISVPANETAHTGGSMPRTIKDSEISAATIRILQAAQHHNWELQFFGACMDHGDDVYVNNTILSKDDDERAVNREAFDRMLHDKGYVRSAGGINYKVTEKGRTELAAKRAGDLGERDAKIRNAKFEILEAADANNGELHWLKEHCIVQVDGVGLADTEEDCQIYNRAAHEMLNDDRWIRWEDGILYMVTAAGKAALREWIGAKTGMSNNGNSEFKNTVFIVHGHDDQAKLEVKNVIYQLELKPIVLHEQPNGGKTIIEKFEHHSDVGFAVILLTPDDFGYSANEDAANAKPRARQNVIMELGFFLCKVGRGKVCTLYKKGVDVPSDIQGVIYTPMDEHGAWKHELAREIKNAGFDVEVANVAS